MVGKRIFELSPIEKKLVWLYQGSGGHIGFSGPGAMSAKCSVCKQFFFRSVYWSRQFKTLKRLQWGGCWPTPARCPTIISIFKFFPGKKKFLAPIAFFQPLPWPLHRKQSSPPPLKDNFIGGWRLGGLVGGAGKSPLGQIWLLFGSSCPRLFLSSTGCV